MMDELYIYIYSKQLNYFLLPSPSHGVPSFLGLENLFAIYIYILVFIKFYDIPTIYTVSPLQGNQSE